MGKKRAVRLGVGNHGDGPRVKVLALMKSEEWGSIFKEVRTRLRWNLS